MHVVYPHQNLFKYWFGLFLSHFAFLLQVLGQFLARNQFNYLIDGLLKLISEEVFCLHDVGVVQLFKDLVLPLVSHEFLQVVVLDNLNSKPVLASTQLLQLGCNPPVIGV